MSEHTLHIEKGGFVNKEKLFAYLRNELNDAEKRSCLGNHWRTSIIFNFDCVFSAYGLLFS